MVQTFSKELLENMVFCFISELDYILPFPLMKTDVRGDWTCRAVISSLEFYIHDGLWQVTSSASVLGYAGNPEVIQS